MDGFNVGRKKLQTKSTVETIKLLIEAGANLDIQDEDCWTALIFASRNSNIGSNTEIVKLLISAGANLDIQDEDGWTALMYAPVCLDVNIRIKIVKLLINECFNPMLKTKNSENAYILFAKKNIICLPILKLLCEAELHYVLTH